MRVGFELRRSRIMTCTDNKRYSLSSSQQIMTTNHQTTKTLTQDLAQLRCISLKQRISHIVPTSAGDESSLAMARTANVPNAVEVLCQEEQVHNVLGRSALHAVAEIND
mmetsp:Transcript_33569/g.80316  ORF Transcript_33569/g.80316 Transcript_33569/m.80316 type:complete len:109 (-) Transcript_33569:839-1165(-)